MYKDKNIRMWDGHDMGGWISDKITSRASPDQLAQLPEGWKKLTKSVSIDIFKELLDIRMQARRPPGPYLDMLKTAVDLIRRRFLDRDELTHKFRTVTRPNTPTNETWDDDPLLSAFKERENSLITKKYKGREDDDFGPWDNVPYEGKGYKRRACKRTKHGRLCQLRGGMGKEVIPKGTEFHHMSFSNIPGLVPNEPMFTSDIPIDNPNDFGTQHHRLTTKDTVNLFEFRRTGKVNPIWMANEKNKEILAENAVKVNKWGDDNDDDWREFLKMMEDAPEYELISKVLFNFYPNPTDVPLVRIARDKLLNAFNWTYIADKGRDRLLAKTIGPIMERNGYKGIIRQEDDSGIKEFLFFNAADALAFKGKPKRRYEKEEFVYTDESSDPEPPTKKQKDEGLPVIDSGWTDGVEWKKYPGGLLEVGGIMWKTL
jgi:hypothetical protein